MNSSGKNSRNRAGSSEGDPGGHVAQFEEALSRKEKVQVHAVVSALTYARFAGSHSMKPPPGSRCREGSRLNLPLAVGTDRPAVCRSAP